MENYSEQHAGDVSRWPIHLEPQNPTMKKKLIVNVAPAGTHISRKQNPNQPNSPEEIASEVHECFKIGASMCHIHVRDKDGVPTVQPERLHETFSLIRSKCPNIIISAHIEKDFTKIGRKMNEEVL